MNRRTFIKVGVMSALAFASVAIGFMGSRYNTRRQIRERLGEWTIDDHELGRFLQAFEDSYGTPAPERDDFIQILVMSTDAFAPGRSGKKLAFVQLYGPYRTPCFNPLARI